MARSFNRVILMGNLTRDPEVRSTPSGQSVCSFSLALNRSYKGSDGTWQEATDFIDVVAWGPLGDRVAQYLTKGRPCLINGRLQSRSWEQDGHKRSKVEVIAGDVTFLGGPGDGGSNGGGASGGNYGSASDDAGATASSSKPAPSKSAKKDDVQIDDISDEPINLDDIPF
jgi:single-strand DNA-binding protein